MTNWQRHDAQARAAEWGMTPLCAGPFPRSNRDAAGKAVLFWVSRKNAAAWAAVFRPLATTPDRRGMQQSCTPNQSACSRIDEKHRLNLHACYLDSDESPDRDAIQFHHFGSRLDWSKEQERRTPMPA